MRLPIIALAALALCGLLLACEANGAVVLELPRGELYCQDNWDASEVDERRQLADDVVEFSPGNTCERIGFTQQCAGSGDTTFFLPHYNC